MNVATVPHRSPFRYAGGKTWFVPYFREWMRQRGRKVECLVEPFAGGATVALTAVFEGWAERAVLIECDEQVGAVWRTLLSDKAAELIDRVRSFSVTEETVRNELAILPSTLEAFAFQTIVRNRVNRGGILAPGTGILKQGEAGRGLQSRWYPETLARRMQAIYERRKQFCFLEGDGLSYLKENTTAKNTVFFLDPPYTAGGKKAGNRLYKYSVVDHAELFSTAASLSGDFLMTYDDAVEVRDLAARFDFCVQTISMKNTHHARLNELVIEQKLNKIHGR